MSGAKKSIAVVGAGTGGCRAALYAAGLGAKVRLYERDRVGGVCLHSGCLPARGLLEAVRRNAFRQEETPDWGYAVSQLRGKLRLLESAQHRALHRAGVEIISEEVSFDSLPEADAVIMAVGRGAGSAGAFSGCTDKRLLRCRELLALDSLPETVGILGAGPTGLEYAWILSGFGCRVKVYEREKQILPGAPLEAAERMAMLFEASGIALCCGAVAEPSSLPEELLLATGAGRPAALPAGENIFPVGDCAGTTTACEAMEAAERAVDRILGRASPAVRYTPNVIGGPLELCWAGSQTGKCGDAAGNTGPLPLLLDAMDSHVTIYAGPEGQLAGFCLFMPEAAEAGSLLCAAMEAGLPLRALASARFFHPSFSELIREAAGRLCESL